nr:DNA methyltransferase [Okeania sp. SIO2F4]
MCVEFSYDKYKTVTQNQNTLPLNQILLTDCINLLKSLPDESVDLVVSSPPYNLGKEYEARKALEIYLEEQTIILQECTRILKNTGSLF